MVTMKEYKKYDSMSNAELNLVLKSLENDYTVKQKKVVSIINELKTMNDEYIAVQEILNKRKKF